MPLAVRLAIVIGDGDSLLPYEEVGERLLRGGECAANDGVSWSVGRNCRVGHVERVQVARDVRGSVSEHCCLQMKWFGGPSHKGGDTTPFMLVFYRARADR